MTHAPSYSPCAPAMRYRAPGAATRISARTGVNIACRGAAPRVRGTGIDCQNGGQGPPGPGCASGSPSHTAACRRAGGEETSRPMSIAFGPPPRKRDRAVRRARRRTVPLDSLRLVFTCCHPALSPEAQVALTLRTVCGLDTVEIARAFLCRRRPGAAARSRQGEDQGRSHSVRGARRRRARRAARQRHGGRLPGLQRGISASFGADLLRADLCAEAIALATLSTNADPARPDAGRAPPGPAGSEGAPRADAAP